jgi:hypothetical protein
MEKKVAYACGLEQKNRESKREKACFDKESARSIRYQLACMAWAAITSMYVYRYSNGSIHETQQLISLFGSSYEQRPSEAQRGPRPLRPQPPRTTGRISHLGPRRGGAGGIQGPACNTRQGAGGARLAGKDALAVLGLRVD